MAFGGSLGGGGGGGGAAYGTGSIGHIPSRPRSGAGALGGGTPMGPIREEEPKKGGGRGRGRMRMPKMKPVKAPPRPELPPIDPQAPFDPNLEAYRERYGGHLTNLEEGTGYAMDVLRQQQQDAGEAEIESARANAAAAGIPFDEAEARAELQRGVNVAMAGEKLGREAGMTQAYGVGKDIYGQVPGERNVRLGIDLQRDLGEMGGELDLYGRDIQRYGVDVNAAVASNQQLMSFYNNLMSGAFGMMGNMGGPGFSSSVSYG